MMCMKTLNNEVYIERKKNGFQIAYIQVLVIYCDHGICEEPETSA